MASDIVSRVGNLNVWKRGDERAPHKPLLLLLAIGRYVNGHDRLIPFREVELPLKQLLLDFGPARKVYHAELPFWHLQSDGIWEIPDLQMPKERVGSASVKKSMLLTNDAHGGVPESDFLALKDPSVVASVVATLLADNFPESIHDDILSAVGLDPGYVVVRRRRDPAFREAVLRAYGYECAICGFSSRIGHILVGVEAAHIKWHQAGGPDLNHNGLALCALHHKLLDRGIITFAPDLRVLVSEQATGTAMFDHLVLDFHGRNLRQPVRREYRPNPEFLDWHVAEVFHPPAREVS